METIKQFENLTQLWKFEKLNEKTLRITDMSHNASTEIWTVTFTHL